MKSERRHELQHNELAEWLFSTAKAIKPYQNVLLAAALLVVVALASYTVWSRMAAAQTAQAWDEVNAAIESGDVARLAKVVEDYPNSNVAHMAALVLADSNLGQGCNQLFTNKAAAQQELTRAIELYQLVLGQSQVPSLLERATFGLARAKESKGDAEHIDQAERLYEEIATKWPNGTFAVAARQRLNDLKRPATKTVYDLFAHFDPKPAFSPQPGGKPQPGEKPSFDLNNLPPEGSTYTPETTFNLKLDGADKGKVEAKDKAKDNTKDKPKEKASDKAKDNAKDKAKGSEKTAPAPAGAKK
jgi:hypothetical protein